MSAAEYQLVLARSIEAGCAPESMVRVRFCAMHESHAAERTPPLKVNGACWHVACPKHKLLDCHMLCSSVTHACHRP